MNWYKFSKIIDKKLNLDITPECLKIIQDLKNMGYLSLIVGGAVRDALLGYKSKDVDIEVYGIDYEKLSEILSQYGKINLVGKSFGVIKLDNYDFSIPRIDNKAENDPSKGTRGRGIDVELKTDLTPLEASSRRDFTFNSMMYDPLEEKLYDYFGGASDIDNKIIRATSEHFAEDQLRVLRGMQFAARFGFTVDPETAKMAKSIKDSPLVKERIYEEWMKLFTKGKYPSYGLQYLIDTRWIENYPELNALVNVKQDSIYHPEGVLDKHIGYAMNAAAKICEKNNTSPEDRAILMSAVLCHDMGKPEVTIEEDGRIKSPGHDKAGVPLAKSFLNSIGMNKKTIDKVLPLVEYHMFHLNYDPKSKKMNSRQLSEKLYPATIKELLDVIESDHSGRPPLPGGLPDEALRLKEDSESEGVYNGKIVPLLQGKDIIHLFEKPGPLVGEALNYVYNKQLEGAIRTKEEAFGLVDKYLMNKLLPINGNDILSVIGGVGGPHIAEILKDAWESYKSGEKVNIDWIKENYSEI